MSKIGEVVGRPLTKNHLNTEIFLQLANSDLNYISSESKVLLRNYSESKGTELEDSLLAKKLWVNLLIDSICILKINDSREKLYSNSRDSQNFCLDFSNIRKSSSYGIDEIATYFDEFTNFERVLYGTDEHYRDHVDHVLQVWAIGIGLIYKNEFVLSDGFTLGKFDFHFEAPINENITLISKSEFWSMWTIAALCHDLGYPIEKTSKINKQAKKIISHFGNMNFSELNYSFDIFNTFLVSKFLNVISSKASIKEGITTLQTKYRDKFSKSLEDYKHGIFSSLLLYKNLTYFLETDYIVSKSELANDDLRQFYIRKEILRAIACHTCPKIYHLSLNTLSFLLILCDELQEWNRPKFDELRYKSHSDTPTVILQEFDPQKQSIKICFKYNMDYDENDIKYLVDNRFKTIHYLLRSAKEDSDRYILFNWDIITATKKYTFNFNSSENSFKMLNISECLYNSKTKEESEIKNHDIYATEY